MTTVSFSTISGEDTPLTEGLARLLLKHIIAVQQLGALHQATLQRLSLVESDGDQRTILSRDIEMIHQSILAHTGTFN